MMISPQAFREMHENSSMKQLFKVRREIMEELMDYENDPDRPDMIMPGRKVIYQMNNLYLIEICRLIEEKLEEED